MARNLKIVYFAWVKERLGRESDDVVLDDGLETVGDLIARLSSRDPVSGLIFSDIKKLRFALDQDFTDPSGKIGDARELAIFPPVTGG